MPELIIKDEGFHSLKDKVVVITGMSLRTRLEDFSLIFTKSGCSGIGLATALLSADHGAKVVVGDINPLPSNPEIEGKSIAYVPLDVTSWDSQSAFFKKAHELHGRIDHVLANAGKAGDRRQWCRPHRLIRNPRRDPNLQPPG